MKRFAFILFPLIASAIVTPAALAIYSYEQDFSKAAIYKRGKIVTEVEFDSIAVKVAEIIPDPQPESDIYYQISGDVYQGHDKMIFAVAGDDSRRPISGILFSDSDLYSYSRQTIWVSTDPVSYHGRITVWKNNEFLFERECDEFWSYSGISVDGTDVYLWGRTYEESWSGESVNRFFYQKGDEIMTTTYEPVNKMFVHEGNMILTYGKEVYTSYNSTNAAYPYSVVSCIETNGERYDVQRADNSKRSFINASRLFNGEVYIGGDVETIYYDSNGEFQRSWQGFIANNDGFYETPEGISEIEDFVFDEKGNYYAVGKKHGTENYHNRSVIRNGEILYDIPHFENTEELRLNDSYISLIDGDVYVYGCYSGSDADSNYIQAGYLVKNGEAVWGLDKDRIIYNIIKRP